MDEESHQRANAVKEDLGLTWAEFIVEAADERPTRTTPGGTRCAHCGEEIGPDHPHVRVNARHVPDGMDLGAYALHPSCWSRASSEWESLGD